YAGILWDYLILLPVAAVAGAIGFLIYARLLGRLGWVTSVQKGGKKQRLDREKPEEADRIVTFDPWSAPEEKTRPSPEPARVEQPRRKPMKKKAKSRLKPKPQATDPWAIPPEEPPPRRPTKPAAPQPADDPYGPVEGTYELMSENAPLAPPPPV